MDTNCKDKNTVMNDPFNLELLTNQIQFDPDNMIQGDDPSGRRRLFAAAANDDGDGPGDKQRPDGQRALGLTQSAQKDNPDHLVLGPDESSVSFGVAVSGETLILDEPFLLEELCL